MGGAASRVICILTQLWMEKLLTSFLILALPIPYPIMAQFGLSELAFIVWVLEVLTSPVMIKETDGGPDENPRFEKNINMGCKTFKELNLDLYIEVTNAPGLSAFNKVERKMFLGSTCFSGTS